MGWDVMPTARNARGIDIIAYTEDGSRYIGIRVKTLSKINPVPLGASLDKIMGDFWVIVNNVAKEPNAFVLLPSEVKQGARRGEKEGRVSYWLQTGAYDKPEFLKAWHRLGAAHMMGSDEIDAPVRCPVYPIGRDKLRQRIDLS